MLMIAFLLFATKLILNLRFGICPRYLSFLILFQIIASLSLSLPLPTPIYLFISANNT